MANCDKLLQKAKNNPADLRFTEICNLVECYGFELARTKGSHFMYKYPGRRELINLQDKNGKAKEYQKTDQHRTTNEEEVAYFAWAKTNWKKFFST